MKFFGWMQNKLTGNCKQGNNVAKPNTTVPSSSFSSHHHKRKNQAREEFSDWPNGLLAIGTFGNNVDIPQPPPPPPQPREIQDVQDEEGHNIEEEDPSSPDELQDFTPEEIGKLQKELTKLLSRKQEKEKEKEKEKEIDQKNMPLDRFLNCPSTLEVSRRISTAAISETDDKEDDIERTISVILGRCRDIRESKKKKAIGKKSLTFLLKKMFVCRSGFAPQPSLRDTLQESRMEKLLRTLLHKKINTQNAPRAPSMKKYIEDTKEDKEVDKRRNKTTDDGCKWVKTDSEYIVLEI